MSDISAIYEDFTRERFAEITLDRVLSSVESMDNLQMWRHPLGFFHAELTPHLSLPKRERFRLHIWLDNDGSEDALGDLHEHTWDLISLVLAGSVRDKTLRPIASPSGAFAGSRITYGNVNTSVEAGFFDLRPLSDREVAAGSHYEIQSRTVHLNAPGLLPTVTLVRSVEDGRGDGPLVLSARDLEVGPATGERKRVHPREVLQDLSAALPGGRLKDFR